MKQPKKSWARTPKQRRGDLQRFPLLHPHWKSKQRQLIGRSLWKAYRQHERESLFDLHEDTSFLNPYRIRERVRYSD